MARECNISFFVLMSPQPPSSTLFPYTTLFRSAPAVGQSPGLPARAGMGDAAARRWSGRAVSARSSVTHSGACWERSEEHTSELQSRRDLVCRLLLEKKKHIEQDIV